MNDDRTPEQPAQDSTSTQQHPQVNPTQPVEVPQGWGERPSGEPPRHDGSAYQAPGQQPPQRPSEQQPAQPRYGAYAPQQPSQQPQFGQQGQQGTQQPNAQHQHQHAAHYAPAGQQGYGAQQNQQNQGSTDPHDPRNPWATPSGGDGSGTPSGTSSATTRDPNRRGIWLPVTAAAVGGALLASLGTAALTGGFDGSSTASLADVGSSGSSTSGEGTGSAVTSSTAQNPNWEEVTTAVAPSVVAIQVATAQGGSEGSGVVIDGDGHIVTNNHVVSGAESVSVTLSDGRLYEADIVGTDPTTDLAVVKIKDAPSDLQPASIGDSDDVAVGEPVLAVGNPLGLANTSTTGIVSALNRPVSASGEDSSDVVVTNAIQIDAAVNPGNSGGPLFDAEGNVIGITSSIASLSSGQSQSGSIGLGFAIPVNLAKNISSQLIENGTAEHAFLGVSLTDASATADGVTRRGAEVAAVTDGSPAADAGITTGDVIVAIGDDAVNGAESLTAFVREREAGEQESLTLVRDGKSQTVDVTFATRPADEQTGGGQGGDSVLPGDGSQGEQGQDQQGEGSDQTQPDNIPDWLQKLFEEQNQG